MRTKLATAIGAIVLVPATASAQTEGLQPGITPGVPMAFVANHGQWDARARFRASRGPATAWFVRGGWVLTFEQPQAAADAEPEPRLVSRAFARPDSVLGVAVAMTFEGATAEPVGEGLRQSGDDRAEKRRGARRLPGRRGPDSARRRRDAARPAAASAQGPPAAKTAADPVTSAALLPVSSA